MGQRAHSSGEVCAARDIVPLVRDTYAFCDSPVRKNTVKAKAADTTKIETLIFGLLGPRDYRPCGVFKEIEGNKIASAIRGTCGTADHAEAFRSLIWDYLQTMTVIEDSSVINDLRALTYSPS